MDAKYFKFSIVDEGSSYDADINAYIVGLSTPLGATYLAKLNTFIVNLKSDLSITNLSEVFDVFTVLANETEEAALRNIVKRDHDATNIDAMSFTTLQGFTGDGANDYLTTDYIPETDHIIYALDDASIGVYVSIGDYTGGVNNGLIASSD